MIKDWQVGFDGREMSAGEIVNKIFEQRNVDIDTFFHPTEDDFIDLERLKNIDSAAQIVLDGIDNDKCFEIIFDVDCDGCTSGAIMTRYLQNYTNLIYTYINQGKSHGIEDYDVSKCRAEIVIIVDSLNHYEQYQKFLDSGKQVVILDHHEIPEGDIEKYDNKRITLVSSCNDYPNNQLSGAGVVWKFCKYLDYLTLNDYADDLVDLTACGLVADMMDMLSPENRYICNLGFNNLQNLAMKKINGGRRFNSQSVSFGIAPLVNAAQRMKLNDSAKTLFLSDDETKVKAIIKELQKAKDEQNQIVFDLMPSIYQQYEQKQEAKVLFFMIDTDADISGLMGNKLTELYQRPVFVLREYEDYYAGSARGFGVDSLMEIVNSTGLAWTGGHPNAFGIRIDKDKYYDFVREIHRVLQDVEFVNKRYADVQIDISQVDNNLIDNFKAVNRISGEGFEPLTVMIKGVTDYEVKSMSNGKHLKLDIGTLLIKWNFNGDWNEFDGRPINVIGRLDSSYFGKTFYQQVIIDDYYLGD